MIKLTKNEFKLKRREKLLDYTIYESNFDEAMGGFDIVRESLSQPPDVLACLEPYDLVQPTHQRALDGLGLLANAYSGGHAVDEIAAYYPAILEFWETYAAYSVILNNADNAKAAHIPLLDENFSYANQLLSFALLLGWGTLIPRLPALFDYNNPQRDGMLERIIASFVTERGKAPDECTKHLPYFKTLKIFNATPENRPALMKEYLEDWYEASRREPYYNSHKRAESFLGYWSWEAAAIAFLLNIDDSSFADAEFYPAGLVEYARRMHAPTKFAVSTEQVSELRVKSGQQCPKAGDWETLDIPPTRRHFDLGVTVESRDAAYGLTIWRYVSPRPTGRGNA